MVNINLIIWIHDSIKIFNKIEYLYNLTKDSYKDILFVCNKNKTAEYYLTRGYNAVSLENEIEKKIENITNLNHMNFFELIDNIEVSTNLLVNSSYKGSFLTEGLRERIKDPISEFLVLYKYWKGLINEKNNVDILILNGMSLASMASACACQEMKKNYIYWENGLLKDSIYLDPIGVNSYSTGNFINHKSQILKKKDKNKSLNDFIQETIFISNDIKNILVTLQVDNDTNIKCSSPFFDVDTYLIYIVENLGFNSKNNIIIRTHPKNPKVKTTILKKYPNISISKNSIFADDLDNADLVLTINSTTGLEAILENKPLISFGESAYSSFLETENIKYKNKEFIIKYFIPSISKNKNIEDLKAFLNSHSILLTNSDEANKDIFVSQFKESNNVNKFHKKESISFPDEKYINLKINSNIIKSKIIKLLNRIGIKLTNLN